METEVIRGLGLAALFFGAVAVTAALAAGGNVPVIALGLILAALAMELLRAGNSDIES